MISLVFKLARFFCLSDYINVHYRKTESLGGGPIKRRSEARGAAKNKPWLLPQRPEDPEGLKGEESISELCRREGISPNLYYNWSKEFLEAGKRRLKGDTKREATSGEVVELRKQNSQLKHLVAELTLDIAVLKKSRVDSGDEG